MTSVVTCIQKYFIAPTLEDYRSSLSPLALSHLKLQLDSGHGGVEADLYDIAVHMLDWDEKLSVLMGLNQVDIHDTKEMYPFKPKLQRYVHRN